MSNHSSSLDLSAGVARLAASQQSDLPEPLVTRTPQRQGGTFLRLFVSRYWAVLVLGIAAAVVSVTMPWFLRPPHTTIHTDGLWYHSWTRGLLDGDLDWCRYATGYDGVTGAWPANEKTGRCGNIYGPGLALIKFPVMAWFTAANGGQLRSGAEDSVTRIFGAIALLVTATAMIAASRRLGSGWTAANVASLATIVGSGTFHYATADSSFVHIWVAAYVAVFALMILWIPGFLPDKESPRGPGPPARPGSLALFFWFFIPWMMMLTRYTTLIVIVSLVTCALAWSLRNRGIRRTFEVFRWPLGVAALGIAVAIAIQTSYNSWVAGSLEFSSYGDSGWDPGSFNQMKVLFSFERGLFLAHPIVLVAFAAAVLARRWWVFAAALLPTLLFVIMFGAWVYWELGAGFGHRGFVDVAPLWGIAFAVGLTTATKSRRAVLYACGTGCVVLTLGLMAAYWTGDASIFGPTREGWFRWAIGVESFPVRVWRGLGL